MKKIYAVVLHDLKPLSRCTILDYYSSKKKALCSLKEKADAFCVDVNESFDDSCYSTGVIDYRYDKFFYCVREIDVL